MCALRRTFLTGESPQSALVVGRIQPRPRVSIVRWNLKEGGGKSLVEGRSNRKYVNEEEVADAAKAAGYEDIYKKSLIGITEMEKLMGKKDFQKILGSLVYKPQGKITLVPESDKRPPIQTETAEADFKEDE